MGLEAILGSAEGKLKEIIISMIVSRIISPGSKLATARGLNTETCSSSLGQILGLEKISEDHLYKALDWLAENQEDIENQLAQKYLEKGSLVLYDISSTYLEGKACTLGEYGYNWITTLRKSQIKKLVELDEIQLGLFDQRNIAEITSSDYPGERLVVCRNPLLAERLSQKREELIQATQTELSAIIKAVNREKRPLRGAGKIGVKVGHVINKYKVSKLFELSITEESFSYQVKEDLVESDKVMDGLYVIRTSVSSEEMSDLEAVKSYKKLSKVERAFRALKTVDLKIRPIYHYKETRVKAHIFLCMLAYLVEWHMCRDLAPLLFSEEMEDSPLTETSVLKYQPSEKVTKKVRTQKNELGGTVHSFQTLLKDLATICLNKIKAVVAGQTIHFEIRTQPTDLQRQALDLLGGSLFCTQ